VRPHDNPWQTIVHKALTLIKLTCQVPPLKREDGTGRPSWWIPSKEEVFSVKKLCFEQIQLLDKLLDLKG
jgi:hypothetical protein